MNFMISYITALYVFFFICHLIAAYYAAETYFEYYLPITIKSYIKLNNKGFTRIGIYILITPLFILEAPLIIPGIIVITIIKVTHNIFIKEKW